MTIGEHLDELRGCVVRSLLALLAACLLCIWPSKFLLELIARPVVLALRHYGQPETFLATAPAEALLIYAKTVVIAGLILASPYVIYELWNFVAAGLFPHERRMIYRVIPLSAGLFLAGVAFMYSFVLLLSLKFLVGFSAWLPMPDAQPTAIERLFLGEPSTRPALETPPASQPAVAFYDADPAQPPPGTLWFNRTDNKLKLQGAEGVYSVQLMPGDRRPMVTTHFRIGEYLTFVLMLTIAFGLAFQMPVVVVMFVRIGLVQVETFRKYRRVVILVIVVIAGAIAPPDLVSHLLLSGPMILLFELGLLLARRQPVRRGPERARLPSPHS